MQKGFGIPPALIPLSGQSTFVKAAGRARGAHRNTRPDCPATKKLDQFDWPASISRSSVFSTLP